MELGDLKDLLIEKSASRSKLIARAIKGGASRKEVAKLIGKHYPEVGFTVVSSKTGYRPSVSPLMAVVNRLAGHGPNKLHPRNSLSVTFGHVGVPLKKRKKGVRGLLDRLKYRLELMKLPEATPGQVIQTSRARPVVVRGRGGGKLVIEDRDRLIVPSNK